MTLEEIMAVPTVLPQAELDRDEWDDENRVAYSADGRYLTDAENFPEEITVRDGCEVICDDVFAFQDYMASRRRHTRFPLVTGVQTSSRSGFTGRLNRIWRWIRHLFPSSIPCFLDINRYLVII